MPMEPSFNERLVLCLPQLLKNSRFKKGIKKDLGKSADKILKRVQDSQPIDQADCNEFSDSTYNSYMECATPVLTLAWDGDAPGMSGAIWLHGCEEIYVITSSDYDDLGPFSSLKDALAGC